MERDARYALVGLASFVIFLAGVVFVVWLAQVQFASQYAVYDVDFKGPVRGLSSGGEVYFNGIKVGAVTRLALDRRDPNRVVARIRTQGDAPIRVDSIGSLEPQGITGVNYIQITAGTTSKPLLRDVTPAGVVPVIRTRQSALEGLLESGGDLLARSIQALDRLNNLLSPDNVSDLNAILANLKTDTALIGEQRGLFNDLDTSLKSLQSTSAKIARLSDHTDQLVTGDGRRTLADLDAAAVELRGATVDARALVARLQGPTADFARTGLPQLSRTVVTLQTTAQDLDRLVEEVERNPRQLLTKRAAKEIEVKP